MTTQQEAVFWGIHAGATGDADRLFLEHNVVALGWIKMPDLSGLEGDRDSFKLGVSEAYPEKTPHQVANNAGQMFRFVHEMKAGDHVIYRSKSDKKVHIGRVTGDYGYTARPEPGYPHHRPVKWLGEFPGTRFSQGALLELGSAMSFFQVRNFADEFRAALEGEQPEAVTEDETVAVVADEIQQSTRDFVLKRLERDQKGHPLQDFVADLLRTMGYRSRVARPGPDGGIDIHAYKDELGIEPPFVKVQVKSGTGSFGIHEVTALYGHVDPAAREFGVFVTLGTFTAQARNFAGSHANLQLIDGSDLVDLILEHYAEIDPRYQTLIPLTRVYVPQGRAGVDAAE